ncbi:MAG TPA: ATP-binding protein [Thermoanaerobaculia bacterium]|nr:ATP-binding protein [Thermoanaerobaculia bacterium]
MMNELLTLKPSVFQRVVESDLRRLATAEKAIHFFLESCAGYLGADAAFLWHRRGEDGSPARLASVGRSELADLDLLAAFAAEERPVVPRSVLLSPLRVAGERVGVLAVARAEGEFQLGQGRVLNRLVPVLGADLERREEEQASRVLDRIREKIVGQLRPRDLAYQILDGLEQLVHYDHSAALFTFDSQAGTLRLDAEKVAWTKSKSAFIGHEVPVTEELVQTLAAATELVVQPAAAEGEALERVLAPFERYSQGAGIPRARTSLYAPLWGDGSLLGLLKIAAWRRPAFGARDASVVARFLPAVEVALRNVRVNLGLEDRAVEAELKAGLVTLAHAVAHDVNGALASIVLLAEQAREEVQAGVAEPTRLAEDLAGVLDKATLARRIFSNMLRMASRRVGAGPVDVNQLVSEVLPLLEAQVGARPIALELALAETVPVVRSSRSHLERILWNLVTNAIESFESRPGRISLATAPIDGYGVALLVADDGPGIAPEVLAKVQEPFFSTKPGGRGLGLSICRSLAWHLGGSLHLDSAPGRGTVAEVRLPLAGPVGASGESA